MFIAALNQIFGAKVTSIEIVTADKRHSGQLVAATVAKYIRNFLAQQLCVGFHIEVCVERGTNDQPVYLGRDQPVNILMLTLHIIVGIANNRIDTFLLGKIFNASKNSGKRICHDVGKNDTPIPDCAAGLLAFCIELWGDKTAASNFCANHAVRTQPGHNPICSCARNFILRAKHGARWNGSIGRKCGKTCN